MDASRFGVRLKELREKAGLTQRQLAEKAGMALGGVNKLEQGVNRPSWESVIALAKALGVTCEAFQVEGDQGTTPKTETSRGRPRKDATPTPPAADQAAEAKQHKAGLPPAGGETPPKKTRKRKE